MARFPTDDACLDHLMRVRYGTVFQCPKCEREARYYRVKLRRCYECERCGNQVYPTAGTPFQKTRTSLRDWYFVMFLFCASRNGVAAKEIQRQIGVTYKTAWRMGTEIRKYMGFVDGDFPLGGPGEHLEIDKTFIGGVDKKGEDDKAVVLGIIERGGDVVTRHIPDRSVWSVTPVMQAFVKPGSKVTTDQARVFRVLSEAGFEHGTINHSKGERSRGAHHTGGIEGYWSMLKRGINGTYVWVSQKHLQKYLWEFEFRHNLRHQPHLMFELLLRAFPRFDPTPWPPEARQSVA